MPNGIDLNELREAIRVMTRRQELYSVLKEELTKLGYWCNRPRGNPARGYEKAKEGMLGGG